VHLVGLPLDRPAQAGERVADGVGGAVHRLRLVEPAARGGQRLDVGPHPLRADQQPDLVRPPSVLVAEWREPRLDCGEQGQRAATGPAPAMEPLTGPFERSVSPSWAAMRTRTPGVGSSRAVYGGEYGSMRWSGT